jgi:hypothetical protein
MTNPLIDVDLDKFHRLPVAERRALASKILDAAYTMFKALVHDRCHHIQVSGLISYVRVKQQLEQAIAFWRREIQRAQWDSLHKKGFAGAGRRPAIKAHGCAALSSLAGSLVDALNRSGNAKKVTA